MLGAAICIAALALAVEFVLSQIQRALTPRGVKVEEVEDVSLVAAPIVPESV